MTRSFFQNLERHSVSYLLISGQATVLYDAAEFSEDLDLWIEPSPENFQWPAPTGSRLFPNFAPSKRATNYSPSELQFNKFFRAKANPKRNLPHANGNSTQNRAPSLTLDSTPTEPCMPAIQRFTNASPMPVPGTSRPCNLSKTSKIR